MMTARAENSKILESMEHFSIVDKLKAVVETRAIVANSFAVALGDLLQTGNPISEALLRDKWREVMRSHKSIYPDGWYLPPPHGIGVLFGTEADYNRTSYDSLRPELNWPKNNVFLDKKTGIIYVYASPVDQSTNMIGDWGMTIYFGKNPDIIEHLKLCLRLNHQVLNYIRPGMTFAELTTHAYELFTQQGLSNQVTSITDPSGVNIGHTVPGSYEDWKSDEITIFRGNEWMQKLTLIKSRRKFLSMKEPLVIQKGMAFTIEQRLTKVGNPRIPMSSFHTIAIIDENGGKQLLTNFEEVFNLVGMNYMMERE